MPDTDPSAPEVVLSARVGNNHRLFAAALRLHVPRGSTVADLTFGVGVFWQTIDADEYTVFASDLYARPDVPAEWAGRVRGGVDCRNTGYPADAFGCVVLDPPYREEFYRAGGRRHRVAPVEGRGGYRDRIGRRYCAGLPIEDNRGGYREMVNLYLDAGREAFRILKPGGVLVVKCQDAVASGRQRLTHVELVNAYERYGFDVADFFVLVRTDRPGVVGKKQYNARKNHSYLMLFTKRTPRQIVHRGQGELPGAKPEFVWRKDR
jgi:hypothetical protein